MTMRSKLREGEKGDIFDKEGPRWQENPKYLRLPKYVDYRCPVGNIPQANKADRLGTTCEQLVVFGQLCLGQSTFWMGKREHLPHQLQSLHLESKRYLGT